MKYAFILFAIVLSSCTYNVSQQQIGTDRRARAAQAVGITNDGVQAGQTLGGTDPPPLSTYPQYNGYPGSGGRGYSDQPPQYQQQSSASSFWRGLFEGIVQVNIGPGYGTDVYGGEGYRSGYVYPQHIRYYRSGPYFQRHYPYYH
jgi:hypothetical protein